MHGVVRLEEATDASRFGGKAAGLAACLRAGFRVPPGVAAAAGCADARIIGRALAAMGLAQDRLAVRSSAIGEDSAADSFAGLLLSVIDVGADALEDAVAQVVASARSREARAYRRRRGLAEDAAMGVVVQRLVAAEVAGVMFTRDPISGTPDLLVEAARGQGADVASGRTTPAAYRLSLQGELRDERPAPGDRSAPLRPEQLASLADLARRVDAAFPGGSDVEWAIAAGEIWLLQRRAITSVP